MDYKEDLFKLIRSGDVVIWAGAGLSLYAGYPKGSDLAQAIYDDLSELAKKRVNHSSSLMDMAEDYERIRGKNSLIQILNKHIKANPDSVEYHKKLASIPQIRTIITTNYDPLFEIAYGERGQKILYERQVPYIDADRVQIIKVHGDMSDVGSLILTKTDYLDFFDSGTTSLLWNTVRQYASTKNILFIGYGLEDPNVAFLFDKIAKALGSHMKEVFFVAPDIDTYRINDLIRKGLNVKYIDSSGQDLIDELVENVESNIYDDFDNGLIPADTFLEFLTKHNVAPVLRGDQGKYSLISLRPLNDQAKAEIKFTILNDEKVINDFNDFIQGRRFGDIKFTEDILKAISFKVDGLPMPGSGKPGNRFFLSSSPVEEAYFDISFGNGFEVTDLLGKVYKSSLAAEVHILYKNLKVIVRTESNDIDKKVSYNLNISEPYKNTRDGVELSTVLKLLHEGEKLSAYFKDGRKIDGFLIPNNINIPSAEMILDYFKMLKEIENHYEIRFTDIQNINGESFHLVTKIARVIKGEPIENEGQQIINIKDASREMLEQYKAFFNEQTYLIATMSKPEEVTLHGQILNIGYERLEIYDPYIEDIEDHEEKEVVTFSIKSKTQKVISTYSSQSPEKLN